MDDSLFESLECQRFKIPDEILVVIVTHNNPVALSHAFESFKRFDPGHPCQFVIIDNASTDPSAIATLKKLGSSHEVIHAENDRVEASFDAFYQKTNKDQFVFFMHDDCIANRDNWLGVFMERMQSGYHEPAIAMTHVKELPIGRVGAISHPWRDYTNILGHPVRSEFLKAALDVLFPGQAPLIYKYADCDRVLVSPECLRSVGQVFSPRVFLKMRESEPQRFQDLCSALNAHLRYRDEGMTPFNLYPPGQCWNKLTLLSEFLNSVVPLIKGFRTVGLEGDGYLEQIHGSDVPWGHRYVHHLGAPNAKEALAKLFNTDSKEIRKRLNDRIFLMQTDRYFAKL